MRQRVAEERVPGSRDVGNGTVRNRRRDALVFVAPARRGGHDDEHQDRDVWLGGDRSVVTSPTIIAIAALDEVRRTPATSVSTSGGAARGG